MIEKDALPNIVTPIPGPRSEQLAQRLSRVESRNITQVGTGVGTGALGPVFWERAWGANVRDVDGNVFVDLTAGFGVANAGHANRAVVEAIRAQAALLPHALGDVHPADIKVRLLERLAQILPAPLALTILANSGAEAVEAALKTAVMRTGRAGVLAFENSYHGLTYGALSATHRRHFRAPFEPQLWKAVHFARFATPDSDLQAILHDIDALLDANDIGAILVEPIQGRGGIVVPHGDFLRALRERCDGRSRVLIFDEVYTGCGRTGRWLACEHWNVVPDVVAIGKALSGALPISACVGTREVMDAWPASTGEAIHTSTFLGNPIACAAALAQLEEIERAQLLPHASVLGEMIRQRASPWGFEVRGAGLLQGIVITRADGTPDPQRALAICDECLQQGTLLLAEGPRSNVLAVTPPAVITDEQLEHALATIERGILRKR